MPESGRGLMFGQSERGEDSGVIGALILVASLGLADSINPVTIVVAGYLAAEGAARPRVAAFTAGVFGIYFLGGLVLLLGPGAVLDTALHGSHGRGFHIASLVFGVIVAVSAVVLWVKRRHWLRTQLPERALRPGSALALGAAVTVIDLPTAFPYFAAIGAIVSADISRPSQVLLLVVFNVLYVLPLLVILIARELMGQRFENMLARLRRLVDRAGAAVVVLLTLAVGIALIARGASGL